MIKRVMKRMMSLVLVAAMTLPGTVVAKEAGDGTGDSDNGVIQAFGDDPQEEGVLVPVGEDYLKIRKPFTNSGVTTWDCIWFGNYWQEDTNGDGYCYAEETNGHPADDKQPIKWRVLDIDDGGYATLLADKLIDIVQYNETWADVTWKTCTLRSYLNGLGADQNVCKKDFSENSFASKAFTEKEFDNILSYQRQNSDNPVYGTYGGVPTTDRIYCLSIDEAMNEDYGFLKNEFTNPSSSDKKYYTDSDPTRVAYTTRFTDDKPGYNGNTAGTSDWWWLRSPGNYSKDASNVSHYGAVDASYDYVSSDNRCVRPAFRMNLSSSSALWKYAGTVRSDGKEEEVVSYEAASNGAGYGYVTLQMRKRDGTPIANTKKLKYTVNNITTGTTSSYEGDTDEEGWITMRTQAVSPDGNKPKTMDFEFTISPDTSDPSLSYTANLRLTAYPFSYTDEYNGYTSVKGKYGPEAGASFEAKLAENGVELGVEAGADVYAAGESGFTMKHSYDGVNKTNSVTFASNYKMSAGAEAEAKAGIEGKVKMPKSISNFWDISVLGVEAGDKAEANYNTYAKLSSGVKIDYGETPTASDYGNMAKGLGAVLLGAYSRTMTGNELLTLLESKSGIFNDNSNGAGAKVKAEASLRKLSVNDATVFELAGAEGEFLTAYDHKYDNGKNTEDELEVATSLEGGLFTLGNVVTGETFTAKEGKKAFDVKVSGKRTDGTLKSLSVSNTKKDENTNIAGKKNLSVTEKFTLDEKDINEYKDYLAQNPVLSSLENPVLLDPRNISDAYNHMLKGFQGLEPQYEESLKNSSEFKVSGDVKVLVGVEAAIGGSESRSAEVGNARLKYKDTGNQTGSSPYVKECGAVSIDTNPYVPLIQEMLDKISEDVFDVLSALMEPVTKTLEKVGDAIYNGCSEVVRIGGSIKAKYNDVWNVCKKIIVTITTPSKSGGDVSSSGYAISTYDSELEAVMGTGEKVTCTVGEPYTVTMTDEEGMEIQEVEEGSLSLTLSYTDEMLTDLGLQTSDAEKLHVYRFDNEAQSYINLGGTVDTGNRKVTIDLTLPGEYILGIDYEAPIVLCLDMTGDEATPLIEARMYDYSGIKTLSMSINGKEYVNTENLKDHFESNLLTYQFTEAEALKPGSYTLSITASDTSGNEMPKPYTYDFTVSAVEPEKINVSNVTLPPTATVKVGETVTLTPTITPDNATDPTVTWKSSDETVATVDKNGVVKGIKAGYADITVTTNDGGKTAVCRVTVTEEKPEPEPVPSDEDLKKDIDVDKADQKLTMLPGETRRLNLNKTGKYLYSVGYVSSDPKVVSVKNGVVTAKKAGSATVTASYCGTDVPFTITVDGETLTITQGDKGSKISATKTVNAVVGTGKTVSVKLPKSLQGKTVTPDKADYGCFIVGAAQPDAKGSKVTFAITPKEVGAAYIVWTVKGDDGKPASQAVTKVIVKKPIELLSVNGAEAGLNLTVGEGKRMIVTTTIGNTDTKDLSYSVKGKGVKVSKSGYVVATMPNANATVTVKSGKLSKIINVKSAPHTGDYLTVSKPSVNTKRPKSGGKDRAVALKLGTPKKNPPAVTWALNDPATGKEKASIKGMSIDQATGKVTITSDASPGCYTVTATPMNASGGFNTAYSEIIVK